MVEPQAPGEWIYDLKVAVTGYRGFIGHHLVTTLRSLKVETVPVPGDVRLPETWAIGHFDLVFHLASSMPNEFASNPGSGFANNFEGTLQALEACRTRDACMVFASTCGVYSSSMGGAIPETCSVEPQTPYAQSKLMAEMLCHTYADHYGVPSTIFRFFNVYGTGQRPEFVIPYLVQCGLAGQEAVVRQPDSARDFVYISDVVNALLCAAKQGSEFSIFNVGLGQPHTIRQVVDAVSRILGRPLSWKQGEGQLVPQQARYAEISHIREKLDWSPRVDLEQGLSDMISIMACHGR
jgi:nucleoside-diphosphate-sugar epimerase